MHQPRAKLNPLLQKHERLRETDHVELPIQLHETMEIAAPALLKMNHLVDEVQPAVVERDRLGASAEVLQRPARPRFPVRLGLAGVKVKAKHDGRVREVDEI